MNRQAAVVLDGHTDLPTRLWESPVDLGLPQPDRHIDFPRLRRGQVDALVCALWVPASLDPDSGMRHARELHRQTVAHLAPGMKVAATAADVRRIARRGEVAVLFALENGLPLVAPEAFAAIAGMGARYVTLTHVRTHDWCDSSTDAPRHGGLSSAGVDLVRTMNRRGILADVSHASDDAVLRVLEVAPLPPLASHSSARALCDQPRNLPDLLVREIARRDGLVMANSYPAFLSPAAARAAAKRQEIVGPELEASEEEYLRDPSRLWRQRADLVAAHPLPPVSVSVYLDHLVHLLDLAGEEHVGIGTDFDGIPETLVGFEDTSCFPSLAEGLRVRGLDRRGVELVMGENFLRLLERAERFAS